MLREPEARDRAAFIELLVSPEVHTCLGGPRPRDEREREMPGAPEQCPGSFVVDLDGAVIGQILLRRATGHRRPAAAGKTDLGLPVPAGSVGIRVRRRGVRGGTRLVRGRPSRRAGVAHHPDRQRRLDAPRGKLGFTEVERFQAWDAEQWLGLRPRSRRPRELSGPPGHRLAPPHPVRGSTAQLVPIQSAGPRRPHKPDRE